MLMISLGGQERHREAAEQLAKLKALAPHFERAFVERFLDDCQEHKALLLQTFALLRTVWPDERTRGPETAAVTRLDS
jgi:hypothetical protein